MVKKSKKQQYSIEKGFISKLLECKDFKLLKDQQIKPFFLTGDNRRVFNFVSETFKTTGEVPTVRVINQKFPNYALETYEINGEEKVGTEETMLYWCRELRTKAKHNRMVDVVEEVAQLLDEGDTEKAYATLKKGVWKIEDEIVESSSVDITKNTEDRKQMYLDRKKTKGMVGISTGIPHLDYILKGLIKETLTTFIANTGIGKAVTLSTPVLTPNGFVDMRNIKVGSVVFDEKGNPCNVLKIYPQGKKQIYRVRFEDNTYIDCCKDHLWKFKTIDDVARKNDWRVETTEQLLKRPIKRGRGYNLCIPVAGAIDFPTKDLPLNPYVLGCLLGDGGFTTDRISFTNTEKDIVETLNTLLKGWGYFRLNKSSGIQYLFKSNTQNSNLLYRTIKELGLIKHNSLVKFIPKDYLYADKEQRLALLQGLIDTDGFVDKKGHVHFFTGSEELRDNIMQLIRSLGFRCSTSDYDRKNKKNIEYVVRIWSDSDIFFRSKKHKERYSNRKVSRRTNYYNHLKITGIELLDVFEEMQCITVDSPYSTFVCGDFIVTHNTWLLVLLGAYAQLNNYKVCCFITEMSTDLMQDRFEAMLFGMMYGDFSYSKFKSGALDTETENQYFEFLENDLPKLEPLIIETATGISSVVSVIEREKPDLVLIDGAYLMEDEQGAKDDWLRVTHITRDIKKAAKNWHIPIVINTQADKNTSKKTGPELGSIMYTQSIGQDSDNVLALFRDEVMINDKEMGIKVLKQREGVLGKVIINWDFDTMNFKSIYSENNSSDTSSANSSNEDLPENVLGL